MILMRVVTSSMNDRISINQLYQRIPPTVQPRQQSVRQPVHAKPDTSFEQLLQAKLLKFSHHAEMRLAERGIRMNASQLAKLEDAVQQAEAKGARESLILTRDAAFIVNVKNRTVVTAIDHASLEQHVFTQIDSAVIVNQ